MKRALVLIVVLTAGTFGCGWWLDHLQQHTACRYLAMLDEVRTAVLDSRMDDARREESHLHALWQHDAGWLNTLISHHHTRDVNSALLKLATALEMNWHERAILALDEARDALDEVAHSDLPAWENIL